MTIYQQLNSLGYAPDDCLGEKVVTIFRSSTGLGLGLFGQLLVTEFEIIGNVFIPCYELCLNYEMLKMSPEELLELVVEIHRVAESNGLKIKREWTISDKYVYSQDLNGYNFC